MQREKQFIADASHDLKTPLSVILANNAILLENPEAPVGSVRRWVDSSQEAAKRMQQLISQMLTLADVERPDAVLCVGQAGGRAAITPERVAINLMDARIPDNAGYQPIDTPVVPDGPAAFFSTLPVKAIAARIQSDGLPAAVSNTAGTYVCNSLLYTLLHTAAVEYPGMPGGFIHVPYALEQLPGKPEGTPGLALQQIARGLSCAIEAIAEAWS